MFNRETPHFQLVLLRIAVGCAWLIAGYEKVTNPAYDATLRAMLGHWAAGAGAVPQFIGAVVLPNAGPLAFAIKAGELLIGLLLVIGFLTPLAAFGGFAIIAAAWVFKQSFVSLSGYSDGNFVLMITMLFLMLTPSGRYAAFDRLYFGRRRRRVEGVTPVPGVEQPVI